MGAIGRLIGLVERGTTRLEGRQAGSGSGSGSHVLTHPFHPCQSTRAAQTHTQDPKYPWSNLFVGDDRLQLRSDTDGGWRGWMGGLVASLGPYDGQGLQAPNLIIVSNRATDPATDPSPSPFPPGVTTEQLILHLVFTETVKVHSLNLVAPELGTHLHVSVCLCV